ncbi:MAG: hypothetical protein HY069_04575 [Chlamydiia bacterium]|nr:hypothetical protein [Chlamydiia bacterium]
MWTMRQALWCLIGSTLVTFLLSLAGWCIWRNIRHHHLRDPRYRLQAIVQTGPEKEALKTAYLAQQLGLSVDRPLSLYAFNLKKGCERLLASPLIAKASLKAIFPATLYVDYEVRKPCAYLQDYENIALDREGYLFPVSPFFSPKELPEIYLGLPPFGSPPDRWGRAGGEWNRPLRNAHFQLAMDLLSYLEKVQWKEGLKIQRIDVSNAFHESLGIREVVLFTEETLWIQSQGQEVVCTFPKILRLSPKDYAHQIDHFLALKKGMVDGYRRQIAQSPDVKVGQFAPRIIDLRIPQLAFIENQ